MTRPKGYFSRWLMVLAGLLLATTLAHAAVVYDAGYLFFTPTGNQFGRIARDGVPSDWSGPKPFPGVIGAPAARACELITVNTGPFPFIQVNFDDPAAAERWVGRNASPASEISTRKLRRELV